MTVRKDFHGLKQLLHSKQPILYQNMFFFSKINQKIYHEINTFIP